MDELQSIVCHSNINSGPLPTIIKADVISSKSQEFIPVTKRNTCYIAGSVVLDQDDRVLLIQEAKRDCWGQWYLPAGRVEPNETFKEAVQRETLEEAGLQFEPTSLLSVEIIGNTWYRFIFTGNVTGGELKTEADSESLQAQWFPVRDVMNGTVPIRLYSIPGGGDILPLIQLAVAQRKRSQIERTLPCLPISQPHKKICVRYLLLTSAGQGGLHVLVNSVDDDHLPIVEVALNDRCLQRLVLKLTQVAFTKGVQLKLHGVGGVEYSGGTEGDGALLTFVYSTTKDSDKDTVKEPYTWRHIEDEAMDKCLQQCSYGYIREAMLSKAFDGSGRVI